MDDIPYMLRGITHLATESSTLISSSRYLNNPALRDWVATELLRKNGPDLPTPTGSYRVAGIIKDMQDYAKIDAMMEEERRHNAVLDGFLTERFVSRYTLEDLAAYPPGSVGRIFHDQLAQNKYQLQIVPPHEPSGHYDYLLLRFGQTHDLEHLIVNGGFDSLGEVVVGLAKLENLYKHFSPQLAGELAVMQFFASIRFLTRTALHYPQVWHDTWAAIERGRAVGKASDAYLLARYEPVFHLTPSEARKALGVRAVDEVADSTAASRIWDGQA